MNLESVLDGDASIINSLKHSDYKQPPTSSDYFLYPEIEPNYVGRLKVDNIHELYFEECGNPEGKPILFIHGGPGGNIGPRDRRFFDPSAYRIILFNQRGCGQSTPRAELENNTTWHLVGDIEKLRVHLNIDKWVLFGGSWGSTLAIAYAEEHPNRVTAIVLRGVFLVRKQELKWFYQEGASHLYPDLYEKFLQPIPKEERGNVINAYYKHLTSDDYDERVSFARAWSMWESATCTLNVSEKNLQMAADNTAWALQIARIECHYFFHGAWLQTDTQLLDNIDRIKHIPCSIVQGRYDLVCPVQTAWDLHKRWPGSELFILPAAGHATGETGISKNLVMATDKYKYL